TDEHALEETRREFLATASHELRTPLAAVYGAAQTLRSGVAIARREHEQLLGMIVRESERLSRILDDILLANRIDAGAFLQTATSCDGGRVAREVLELAAQRAPAPIELALAVPESLPPVEADEDALRQVLVNLVDNAIKYSPEGGRVELAVGA